MSGPLAPACVFGSGNFLDLKPKAAKICLYVLSMQKSFQYSERVLRFHILTFLLATFPIGVFSAVACALRWGSFGLTWLIGRGDDQEKG